MASSDSRYAVDTSFAIPAIDPTHVFHEVATRARQGKVLALSGHAAFETFSVLTRMPGNVAPDVLAATLATSFPEYCPLSARGANQLFGRLADLRIVGGAVYDALVAAAALENDRILLTCDRRATPTFEKVGVRYELVVD